MTIKIDIDGINSTGFYHLVLVSSTTFFWLGMNLREQMPFPSYSQSHPNFIQPKEPTTIHLRDTAPRQLQENFHAKTVYRTQFKDAW